MNVLNLSNGLIRAREGDVETADPGAGPFDEVLVGDVLGDYFVNEVEQVIQYWYDLLEPGGKLHLLMPSMEWAQREFRAGRAGPHVYLHIFGTRERPRHAIYTLLHLRELLDNQGFAVIDSSSAAYVVTQMPDGTQLKGDRHYVVALKRDQQREEKRWGTRD